MTSCKMFVQTMSIVEIVEVKTVLGFQIMDFKNKQQDNKQDSE